MASTPTDRQKNRREELKRELRKRAKTRKDLRERDGGGLRSLVRRIGTAGRGVVGGGSAGALSVGSRSKPNNPRAEREVV